MINIEGTPYRLCLLDTCIVSEMLKSKDTVGKRVLDMVREGYVICFSIYNLIELKQAPDVYNDFCEFFNSMPSLLMKNYNQLLTEEIRAYTKDARVEPVLCPLLADPTAPARDNRIRRLFESEEFIQYEQRFNSERKNILDSVLSLIGNYPPKSGKYTKKEIEEFVQTATIEQLILNDPGFVQNELDKGVGPDASLFPSVQMSLYIVFYKFYLTNKRPVASDVADFIMASLYPYVDAVILEKNQAEQLRQIKTRHNVVTDLEIMTLRNSRVVRI